MPSVVHKFLNHGLISPPSWLQSNLAYETMMGSHAYGCHTETSDVDIYGFCFAPKFLTFPHLNGHIVGYDDPTPFNQWQQDHVKDEHGKKEYDFHIFNIVRFFKLASDCNPNVIDSLFTPSVCVRHVTPVGQLVLDNRHLFLSKEIWIRMRAYACSQFHKMKNKQPEGKRLESVEKWGYDLKFAYHCIRLMDQCEQLLTTGTMELTRNREEYKAIRRGDWTFERLEEEFTRRKLAMEDLIHKTKLPDKPDRKAIKSLLLKCLESHYGSLENAVTSPEWGLDILREIDMIVGRIRSKLY